jgi:Putative auto-transporter adhesin, head GIN domain
MRTFIPLIAVVALAGCGSANGETSAKRDGPKVTRSFAAKDFDAVALKGSDDVRIVYGKDFAISASGPTEVVDALDIRVEGNTLRIDRKRGKGWNWNWSGGDHDGAIITVTMPLIRSAVLAGSGDMSVDGTAEDTFDGALAGSGTLTIAGGRAATMNLSIAGSGDVIAAGSAKSLSLSIAGSGDLDAARLSAEQISASVAGSGDITGNATGKADVSIVGSGDVTITGTKNCTISKTGSGEVRCTA